VDQPDFNKPLGFFPAAADGGLGGVHGHRAVPLGAATLSFFPDPSLASNVVLTAAAGAFWFVIIGIVLIAGIS